MPFLDASARFAAFAFVRGSGFTATTDRLFSTSSNNHFEMRWSTSNRILVRQRFVSGNVDTTLPFVASDWYALLTHYDGETHRVYNFTDLLSTTAKSGRVTNATNSSVRVESPVSTGAWGEVYKACVWARGDGDTSPFPAIEDLLLLCQDLDPADLPTPPDWWVLGDAANGRGLRDQAGGGNDLPASAGIVVNTTRPPGESSLPEELYAPEATRRSNTIVQMTMSLNSFIAPDNPAGFSTNRHPSVQWWQGRFDAIDYIMEQLHAMGLREVWFWNLFGRHDPDHPGTNGHDVMPWYLPDNKHPDWDASWTAFRARWRARGMRLGFWMGGVAVPNLGTAAAPNLVAMTGPDDFEYVGDTLAALRHTEGFDAVGLDFTTPIRTFNGGARRGADMLVAFFDYLRSREDLDGLYYCGERAPEPGRCFGAAPANLWGMSTRSAGGTSVRPTLDDLLTTAQYGYDSLNPGHELITLVLSSTASDEAEFGEIFVELPKRGYRRAFSADGLRLVGYMRFGGGVSNGYVPVGPMIDARVVAPRVVEVRFRPPRDSFNQPLAGGWSGLGVDEAKRPNIRRADSSLLTSVGTDGVELLASGAVAARVAFAEDIEPQDALFGLAGWVTGANSARSGGLFGAAPRRAGSSRSRDRSRARALSVGIIRGDRL